MRRSKSSSGVTKYGCAVCVNATHVADVVCCQCHTTQELKRKDDIAVRLNAARLSALETTETCKTLTNQVRALGAEGVVTCNI